MAEVRSGEPWLAEPANGTRVVVQYAPGGLFVLRRDDPLAVAGGWEDGRRWWRDHGDGMLSGPYLWTAVLDEALQVYRLVPLGEAPRG